MADAVSGATGKIAMGLFGPHPSITIVTFWQGIVEIVLRALTIVSQLHCSIEYMRKCAVNGDAWRIGKRKGQIYFNTSAMWLVSRARLSPGKSERVWLRETTI